MAKRSRKKYYPPERVKNDSPVPELWEPVHGIGRLLLGDAIKGTAEQWNRRATAIGGERVISDNPKLWTPAIYHVRPREIACIVAQTPEIAGRVDDPRKLLDLVIQDESVGEQGAEAWHEFRPRDIAWRASRVNGTDEKKIVISAMLRGEITPDADAVWAERDALRAHAGLALFDRNGGFQAEFAQIVREPDDIRPLKEAARYAEGITLPARIWLGPLCVIEA